MKYSSLLAAFLFMGSFLNAQTLSETEIKVSKDARKTGSYFGGGIDHLTNQTVAIMVYPDKDEGVLFDIYRFDAENQPLEPVEGLTVDALAQHLNYESTDTDQKTENSEYDGQQVLLVRSNFIGRDIVIEKGKLNHQRKILVVAKSPSNPFSKSKGWISDRLLFEKDSKEKIDLNMMPLGTLVYEGQFPADALEKMQQSGNTGPSSTGLIGSMKGHFEAMNSAIKAGLNAAFMTEGGKAVVIGRVVEEVNIKDPTPFNNNRLRVVTVDGTDLSAEEKLTYELPFAFLPAATKSIMDHNKMVALLVPLNSPTTVKEGKKYNMEKGHRNRVMVTIVDDAGNVNDTSEFRSAGNNGRYEIFENNGAIYIPAVIDADKSGFYNGHVTKPTHFQITMVNDGAVKFNKAYNFDEIADKASVADGEKFKKFKVGNITWQEPHALPNGDMVFFAIDESNFYAFHTGTNGELHRVFVSERFDEKGSVVDSRFIVTPGGKFLWMTRETPEGIQDTELDIRTSISSSSNGMYRTTTATATAQPRNVMEIKAVTKIMAVDPSTGKLGAESIIGGKDYLVVGDSGFLMNEKGELVFIGYDMEDKKKLYSVKVSI